ncbi:ErmE/ErmH/ErmO/ErmR family 23S rRNA (adenine(2058)-N(6))-methyltransferase [Streptomyces sp. DSM 44915]|uniref:ErmE/ErmH/ErmO/ErmR family 23S rRNA (Adenine(2058)-N(6))-methyltransferase n=1 Tax=Streptomyces chisholmiae TaxID=3075540 RepID=A0ABU2JLF6_9ACTN|nr:ErmE/ErmH/ErmO/ErmR family 23S rRNA (adenine(2058)-N(6))-methyltransferase [Streptomyces sp. DSM 44915]MDT0265539.1 ErmE/ErmH/ErmO/ErmR family 23S rRNA (adenine(2058)-N(6))-methyltransferase [Streptomyces sp. DSM 44915]
MARQQRRKTLSQNFLRDAAVLRQIVRAAELAPSDLVVEPGAGEGTLTRALARASREVIAHEIDPALAGALPRRLAAEGNVRVVRGDFLRTRPPGRPFVVVGNIPYSRTTDIVRWCLDARELTAATLVTQREFARRRTGDYGSWPLLTVRSWPEFDWRLGPRISRYRFEPVPRTDSAVLRLVRRPAPLLPAGELPTYRALVAEGFTGVGGSLAATLRRDRPAPRVRAALVAARIPLDAPVGRVTPRQWLTLHRALRRAG